MKTKFIDEEIKYIGSQLAPHWIYKNYNIQGDAIVAFIGECEVNLSEMVDIEDVINNEPIYSKCMLSFISEQFGIDLIEGVFRQRLLICIIKELLEEKGVFVVRKGDAHDNNGSVQTVAETGHGGRHIPFVVCVHIGDDPAGRIGELHLQHFSS